MTSPDRLENIFSFFTTQFSLSQGEILSWQRFLLFLSCHFFFFNPDVVGYFVKIIRNNQNVDILLTFARYKNQWEVSQLKTPNRKYKKM